MRVPAMFIRMYGDVLSCMFADRGDFVVAVRPLPDADNEYRDMVARLGNTIYISERECGLAGFSDTDLMAALAHEIGHIVYGSLPFGLDAEMRADTLAFELGLGTQMKSAIDKIIATRRYRHLTSQLVRRLQMLTALERSAV